MCERSRASREGDQWVLPPAWAIVQRKRGATCPPKELTDRAATNCEAIRKFLPVRMQTEKSRGGWPVVVMP
jgi:hypothetical protein